VPYRSSLVGAKILEPAPRLGYFGRGSTSSQFQSSFETVVETIPRRHDEARNWRTGGHSNIEKALGRMQTCKFQSSISKAFLDAKTQHGKIRL